MKSRAFYKSLFERMRRVHTSVDKIISEHGEAMEAVELLANRADWFCTEYCTEYEYRRYPDIVSHEAERRIVEKIAKQLLEAGYIKVTKKREVIGNESMVAFTAKVRVIKDENAEENE